MRAINGERRGTYELDNTRVSYTNYMNCMDLQHNHEGVAGK